MLTPADLAEAGFTDVAIAATDVQGRLIGRRLPVRQFAAAPARPVTVCAVTLAWDIGQRLTDPGLYGGLASGLPDVHLKPDLATLRPFPAADGRAICLADLCDRDGEPLAIAPRSVLRKATQALNAQGLDVQIASELEFYLFEGSAGENRAQSFRDLRPLHRARADFNIAMQSYGDPYLRRMIEAAEQASIPTVAAQLETGYGQMEITLEHTSPLEMADRHVLFKLAVKEVARRSDLTATFMAQPMDGDIGSSCHLHCSLWQGGRPLFPSETDPQELSPAGSAFLGGLLAHLDETALLYAPNTNSYKRHRRGGVTTGVKAWAFDNRTATFRVVGCGDSLRIEHRYPGADVNPYVGIAALILSGLDGLCSGTDPGPPAGGNCNSRADLAHTPDCLGTAISLFSSSSFARQALGGEVVDFYARHGRQEWDAFLTAVTDWEQERAFELV